MGINKPASFFFVLTDEFSRVNGVQPGNRLNGDSLSLTKTHQVWISPGQVYQRNPLKSSHF